MLALAVQRRLERGTTDEEIDALVARYLETHGLLFTVDTLEFLARGGRIGRGAAFAGTLLNVKPVLGLERRRGRAAEAGPREPEGARGARWTGSSRQSADAPSLRIGLAHAAAPERLAALERLVREARPQATLEVTASIGAVVGDARRAGDGRALLV